MRASDGAASRDIYAIDNKRLQRIATGRNCDGATRCFAAGFLIRAFGLAAACRQACFVDKVFAADIDPGLRIFEQGDGHSRCRRIAITIGDGVLEGDNTFLARCRGIGKGAVPIIDKRACTAQRFCDHSHASRQVDSICARSVVGKHIDRDGCIFAFLSSAVVDCQRRVINDIDVQIVAGNITIKIGNDNRECHGAARSVQRVVVQRICIGNAAISGDRIIAVRRDDKRAG